MLSFYIALVIAVICMAIIVSFNDSRSVVLISSFIIIISLTIAAMFSCLTVEEETRIATKQQTIQEVTDSLNNKILSNAVHIDTTITVQDTDTVYNYQVIWE